MRTRLLGKMAVLCLLSLGLCIGGAYAGWFFAQEMPEPVKSEASIGVNAFLWDTEEVLPGEEENAAGKNHVALVEALLNGTYRTTTRPYRTLYVGLNGKDYLFSTISNRLAGRGWTTLPSRDTLGSMAMTQGSDLESYFKARETWNLSFLIQVIDVNGDLAIDGTDGDYFYIFTLDADLLGSRGSAIDETEWIYAIYRTQVEWVDGEWAAVGSYGAGSALSHYYEESQHNGSEHMSRIPSFDPNSWVLGDMRTE